MKKILTLLILVSIFLVSFASAVELAGDFDGDGYIQAGDFTILRSLILDIPSVCHNSTGDMVNCIEKDLNQDGQFTFGDYIALKDIYNGYNNGTYNSMDGTMPIQPTNNILIMINPTGDCDGDGYIAGGDLSICKNIALGISVLGCHDSDFNPVDNIAILDFYRDDKINIADCDILKDIIYGNTSLPNWQLVNDICQSDDTLQAQWIELNTGLVDPFNETLSCDSCTPDIVSTNSNCQSDNTFTETFTDNNNCYAQTGLDSDKVPDTILHFCTYSAPPVGSSSGRSSRSHAAVIKATPVVIEPVQNQIEEVTQTQESNAPAVTGEVTAETGNGNLYITAGIIAFLVLITGFFAYKK